MPQVPEKPKRPESSQPEPSTTSRRDFLRGAALLTGAGLAAGVAEPQSTPAATAAAASRPNVLMICADQFRTDFLGANHGNPSTRTPNLDVLARRGTNFNQAVTNQPLCSPSRASFLTSRYATETGVWKLGIELDHTLPTIATSFKDAGYKTAFVGKWHVADDDLVAGKPTNLGWIPPGKRRAGFDDLWEGANIPELASHPFGGSYWDDSGKDIGFHDEYRVDFYTDRAVRFLEQPHTAPWFLFFSILEPHQQNDVDNFVPPHRYEGKYDDSYVPHDLRDLPGNWQTRLPGYYGCVQSIDDALGRIVDTLTRRGELDNTVICFFSDHGNTFRTRMGEYKRSPHDSSIRVPFVFAGPGFNRAEVRTELVSLLDLAPTLLASAGIAPAPGMRGRPVQQLLLPQPAGPIPSAPVPAAVFIQISESMCARALRTPDWCYCVYDPTVDGKTVSHSLHYQEFCLYSISGDPAEQVNLLGRPQYREITGTLRAELLRQIAAAGEPAPEITPARFFC